jgi:hypothetical protein
MARRIVSEVVLILAITIALAWLLLGIVSLFDTPDPLAAFTDGAPRLLFGVTAIALVGWTIMLIIGSIANRNRRSGWRILTHLVSLFVALLINVLVFAGLAFVNSNEGGWGLLLAGIAIAVGLAVGVAGTVAVLVVELAILRPKAAPVTADAPSEAPE